LINYNPLLCTDFYKVTHCDQYPKGLTKLVSYYTPRMSRLSDTQKITMFGLQAFIRDYLINAFQQHFFNRNIEDVVFEYKRVLNYTISTDGIGEDRLRALHALGYLPLMICAVPEGTRTNVGVPQIEISNTHPDFVWLVNSIETMLSCSMWHTQISAEVGYRYRQIVDKFVRLTCDDSVDPRRMLGDFSMRGQESVESATKSSAAWLLSFYNTATIPAILWLEDHYRCNVDTDDIVGYGAISTEHSVMCSNFAVDGDEITHIRRLLTEIYPHQNFSMVSDSYDYWNLVENILPQLKDEILAHDGCLSIRGDSGDPVEIVTQTVFKLWDIFGGSVNSKGYKLLDPHIKAIYGDSITPQRCQRIYEILTEAGFAVNNVILGVGSFSMQCLEDVEAEFDLERDQYVDRKVYSPYTRDTFGIAVKATYAENVEGKPIIIYKNPKTDTGHFKKSQRGCCVVYKTEEGDYSYADYQTFELAHVDFGKVNELKPVFCDGIELLTYTLDDVRCNMYGGNA